MRLKTRGLAALTAMALLSIPSAATFANEAKKELKEKGIDLSMSYTNFAYDWQSDNGAKPSQNGGRGDINVTIDGKAIGLWDGFSVNVNQIFLHGQNNFNRTMGQNDVIMSPVLGMTFPRENETSAHVTQQFGKRVAVMAGKFDMIKMASATPLVGGGGLSTFSNMAIAAPISGIVSPFSTGAVLSVQGDKASYTFMVYDPRNTQNSNRVLDHTFEDGTSGMANIRVPVTIGGKQGYHSITANVSDYKGKDIRGTGEMKKRRWYAAYDVQQYLFQNKDDPSKGWGVFGRIARSDGNPTPVLGHLMVGIGGNSFIKGRSDDLWGVAHAHYEMSKDFNYKVTEPRNLLRPEQVTEAYYNVAVLSWLRVTANFQHIRPAFNLRKPDTVIGIRTQIVF
ncbi:carbohydrate porin [Paraferrimonas sedimenticola]|uniref:Porin n=1 Tax=Paraferrimonas sedimenticola TaxID=375674 RepID=A0AA37RVJ5_9GAMM|nr:carbohydrate porin [Paraferrimonas sedimenticola]GLP96034.1 hypothetical protein GCM10007895_13400 [Paraferrimonas sedimenticola]